MKARHSFPDNLYGGGRRPKEAVCGTLESRPVNLMGVPWDDREGFFQLLRLPILRHAAKPHCPGGLEG